MSSNQCYGGGGELLEDDETTTNPTKRKNNVPNGNIVMSTRESEINHLQSLHHVTAADEGSDQHQNADVIDAAIPNDVVVSEDDRDEEIGKISDNKNSYTCPVCLLDSPIMKREEGHHQDLIEERRGSMETNVAGIPVFTLAATCQHKFCAPCLRAYVESKLLVGDSEIPCCHFHTTAASSDERQPKLCNVTLAKRDIEQLIHMDYFRRDSFVSDWCDSRVRNTAQDNNNEKGSDELWVKYKKVAFDHLHGKDTVRRCPNCDGATLFDVDAMKEHQSKFHSESSAESATAGVESAVGAGGRMRLDRFFGIVRHTQDSNSETAATGNVNKGTGGMSKPQDSVDQDSKIAEEEDEEQPAVLPREGNVSAEGNANNQIDEDAPVKSKSPVVTCNSCNTEFCYFHSNAHTGQSCLSYIAASSEADRTNIEYAHRVLRVKPCPNCGISVSKEGGCNQIKCSSCGTHFCWLCSTIVDGGPFPDHFRWWNLSGCPNMQLDESIEPMRCTVIGARVISVLQLLILGIPALALSFASMLVCPCLLPGCGTNMRERVINCVSFWGSCLSTLIMLPFTILGMFLVASLYCFVALLSCCVKIPPNNAGQGDSQTTRRTPANNEAAQQAQQSTTEELIRELENIFGRLEEGTFREGVELARSYQDAPGTHEL
ncbi:hypothetical protein ACHAWC_007012 [Mediolabrus comicus]